MTSLTANSKVFENKVLSFVRLMLVWVPVNLVEIAAIFWQCHSVIPCNIYSSRRSWSILSSLANQVLVPRMSRGQTKTNLGQHCSWSRDIIVSSWQHIVNLHNDCNLNVTTIIKLSCRLAWAIVLISSCSLWLYVSVCVLAPFHTISKMCHFIY